MSAYKNSLRRISWISILLLPLILAYVFIPQVRFRLNPDVQKQARRNYAYHIYESHDPIDVRDMWKMRSIIDTGAFEKNMDGFTFEQMSFPRDIEPLMMCLEKFKNDVRIVIVYKGVFWKSFELLVHEPASASILQSCLESTQSQPSHDFRFSTTSGMVLMTVRPLDVMKKTIGFIDYAGEHASIVDNTVWYSITYMSLK